MKIFRYFLFVSIVINAIAMEQNDADDHEKKWRTALVERVKKLVTEGIPSNDNQILFEDVIPSGSIEALGLLLKNKINCELPGIGIGKRTITPLICAINYNRVSMVKILLKQGVSVNTPDELGCTPLVSCMVLRNPKLQIIALLLQDPALDLKKLVPWAQGGEGKMMTAYEIAKEEERSAQSFHSSSILGFLKEVAKGYRKVGRMILARLRFDSCKGRVAKGGLLQTGLPSDILKKIAASVDYEAAEKEFKL